MQLENNGHAKGCSIGEKKIIITIILINTEITII